MHTLAVIDKQPILRIGIRLFLKNNFNDITILTADTIENVTPLHSECSPDLFILGMGIGPKTECFDSIKAVKKKFPHAVILLYDQKPDTVLLPLYLKAGVHGYIAKQNDMEELDECIRQLLAGKKYICKQISDVNAKIIRRRRNPAALSSREYMVANYLSQGMKISWIAQTLGIKISTGSTFKNKIFKKLNVENILQLREAMFLTYAH
jgi:two-component system invasion response regulator UvrY